MEDKEIQGSREAFKEIQDFFSGVQDGLLEEQGRC